MSQLFVGNGGFAPKAGDMSGSFLKKDGMKDNFLQQVLDINASDASPEEKRKMLNQIKQKMFMENMKFQFDRMEQNQKKLEKEEANKRSALCQSQEALLSFLPMIHRMLHESHHVLHLDYRSVI
ncbi:hypothetical protein [Paenibacillus sp.]|jgi:hypothetical protein|uniref:hypothetical protein n=1 Tax=Paenibacillus sp. TaxID=58172 RepID=UPI00281AB6FC|nr:hypothetical protein [Paenibacillus sp.]MDR0269876.1 hypothetical protein [Paenibacillus sp.]